MLGGLLEAWNNLVMNCCLEIVPVRRRISNPNVLSCEVISSMVSQKGPKCRQNGPGSLGGIFFIIPEITSSAKRGQVLDQTELYTGYQLGGILSPPSL